MPIICAADYDLSQKHRGICRDAWKAPFHETFPLINSKTFRRLSELYARRERLSRKEIGEMLCLAMNIKIEIEGMFVCRNTQKIRRSIPRELGLKA